MISQPSIQYAVAKDGVSIAYTTIGEGLTAIGMPPLPWSHLKAEWDDPGYRSWFELNAVNKRLVIYDTRGSGLSDRELPRADMDDFLLDVDAVADRMGLEKFALIGVSISGPSAIKYAARNPDRVSHLVLWCSPGRTSDVATPQGDALRVLRDSDWNLYTETIAHAMVAGWGSSDEARRFAALMRASIEPTSPVVTDLMYSHFDVTNEMAEVKCPTLVLQRAEATLPPVSAARYIATRIPNARLAVVEGGALLPWVGDMQEVIRIVDDFLGVSALRSPEAAMHSHDERTHVHGLVTLLFTDIENSTTLTQSLGDATAQAMVRAHNEIVRDALRTHGGREVKHTGDGIMASFSLASTAIEAATAIQRETAAHAAQENATPFRVRVGLNAGEPVSEDGDLFGTAVQLARRVCDQAEPGTILATDVVRQLAAGKGFLFADTGEATLRGFEDPVRLYEVRWQ
jgi:class 3 adenylate cyclase